MLEWVAISFSRGSSWPRDWTQVSRIAGRRFNLWATREAQKQRKELEEEALQSVSQDQQSEILYAEPLVNFFLNSQDHKYVPP